MNCNYRLLLKLHEADSLIMVPFNHILHLSLVSERKVRIPEAEKYTCMSKKRVYMTLR
jgi:hypothetical protein